MGSAIINILVREKQGHMGREGRKWMQESKGEAISSQPPVRILSYILSSITSQTN